MCSAVLPRSRLSTQWTFNIFDHPHFSLELVRCRTLSLRWFKKRCRRAFKKYYNEIHGAAGGCWRLIPEYGRGGIWEGQDCYRAKMCIWSRPPMHIAISELFSKHSRCHICAAHFVPELAPRLQSRLVYRVTSAHRSCRRQSCVSCRGKRKPHTRSAT